MSKYDDECQEKCAHELDICCYTEEQSILSLSTACDPHTAPVLQLLDMETLQWDHSHICWFPEDSRFKLSVKKAGIPQAQLITRLSSLWACVEKAPGSVSLHICNQIFALHDSFISVQNYASTWTYRWARRESGHTCGCGKALLSNQVWLAFLLVLWLRHRSFLLAINPQCPHKLLRSPMLLASSVFESPAVAPGRGGLYT